MSDRAGVSGEERECVHGHVTRVRAEDGRMMGRCMTCATVVELPEFPLPVSQKGTPETFEATHLRPPRGGMLAGMPKCQRCGVTLSSLQSARTPCPAVPPPEIVEAPCNASRVLCEDTTRQTEDSCQDTAEATAVGQRAGTKGRGSIQSSGTNALSAERSAEGMAAQPRTNAPATSVTDSRGTLTPNADSSGNNSITARLDDYRYALLQVLDTEEEEDAAVATTRSAVEQLFREQREALSLADSIISNTERGLHSVIWESMVDRYFALRSRHTSTRGKE